MSHVGEAKYSSTEICEAIRLPRTTLDAWLLRRYIDLPPGPGTGRTRKFTSDEVVIIAVTAELTKLSLNIKAAAHAAGLLARAPDGASRPRLLEEDGWTLIVAPSPAPAGIDAPELSPLALIRAKTLTGLLRYVQSALGNPASVVIVDVSQIARRTIAGLERGEQRKKGRPLKKRLAVAAL